MKVLILKQSLKDFTLEKPLNDIFFEIKRLKEINDILLQQEIESLLQENLSRNTII